MSEGDDERVMLLSVHPRYATAILDGSKTVELRRQRVAVPVGTAMVIYATAPTMAIVGTATVHDVTVGTPKHIWAQHRRSSGVSRDEYDSYMVGAEQASAVMLTDAKALTRTIPLSFLRETGGFQPPQSYRYIGCKELWRLTVGHPGSEQLMDHLGVAFSSS